jgi:ferritin heavy chain
MNWPENLQNALNEHINAEYTASYIYHSMSSFFNKSNVALPGLSKFFEEQYKEEQQHANEFMKYQIQRGGCVKLLTINQPQSDFNHNQKTSALYAMELALEMEQNINNKLLELHKCAEENNDVNFCDFIEKYLEEQVESIYKISTYITQLQHIEKGIGLFLFDKSLQ